MKYIVRILEDRACYHDIKPVTVYIFLIFNMGEIILHRKKGENPGRVMKGVTCTCQVKFGMWLKNC